MLLSYIIALSYDDHHFKSKRSPMLLVNVRCNGSENNLTSCCSTAISNNFHCFNQRYAGVRCIFKFNIMGLTIDYYIAGSQCIENSIQLVDELSQQVGTPVICLGGRLGKVCDPLDTTAAIVVCRQLGFSTESNDHLFCMNFTSISKYHNIISRSNHIS